MKLEDIIGFVLIAIAGSGLYYRIYLEDKIGRKNKKGSLSIFFRPHMAIKYLFPIQKENFSPKDYADIDKANRFLIVFYIAFGVLCFLGYYVFS